MRLLLKNLRLWSVEGDCRSDLRVARGRILERGIGLAERRNERLVDCGGALALPGLINAHDHLGLDLFGRLGKPPYSNFYQWADEIYRPEESPIVDLLQVTLEDRLLWGGYRNLISGVTTVAHHDPPHRALFSRRFPVRVVRDYGWSHSLGLGEDLEAAFWSCPRGRPFFIHAAEGVDQTAAEEIDELDRRGMLAPQTVLIHAVGATERQIERLAETRTSVVWCPASNAWLYGQSLDFERLRRDSVRVALGTDSTLSGSATLFDELRVAHASGTCKAEELIPLVTTEAARISGITDGRGSLDQGAPADVVVLTRDDGESAATSAVASSPPDLALVLIAGRPRLIRHDFLAHFGRFRENLCLDGERFWIAGKLSALRERIRRRVGCSEVLEAGPLWNRLLPLQSTSD